MQSPLLSVCVPTYNRPHSFERMMRSLLPQINDSVEIVIRDDSTNESTKLVIDSLSNEFKFSCRYYKGEKIGLDAANLFLLEKASGEFLWWFSDDDVFLDNALDFVLELISSYSDLNFIWANFAFQEIEVLAIDRDDGLFNDRNDVISCLGTNIGLLSTYIVRVSVAISGLDFARKHVHGFSFASTAIVFWVLTRDGQFYFMRGPYFLCHPTTIDEIKKITTLPAGDIVNDGFITYGIYFHDVVRGVEEYFDKKSINKLLATNFASLWRGMLVGWVGGWDTPEGKRLIMMKLYWKFPELWIALPLFCMPKKVVASLYSVYKIFYSHRKFIFLDRFKRL